MSTNPTTLINPHHDTRPWQDCTREDVREGDLVETRNGGFLYVGVAHHRDVNRDWLTDRGYPITYGDHWPLRRIPALTTEKETPVTENQHPLTEITDEMVEAAAREIYVHTAPSNEPQTWPPTPDALADDYRGSARATLSAALTVATPAEPLARTLLCVPAGHGAPHRDVDRIKPDDYGMQMDEDGLIRGGRAHHQDENGDWADEHGELVVCARYRADHPDALTVWPAPTPAAVEVELPTERPAHLTDVVAANSKRFAYMALDRYGLWVGVDQDGTPANCPPRWITAATLPDGTRIRRDGDREDGTPRFVKADQ